MVAGTRRIARMLALMTLFEVDSTGYAAGPVFESYIEDNGKRLLDYLLEAGLVETAAGEEGGAGSEIAISDFARDFVVDTAHLPDNLPADELREQVAAAAGRLVRDVLSNETDFAHHLVQGVLDHQGELDEIIALAAPSWPMDQMARVDKNVLRLAIQELLYDPDVPLKAAINEAVELGKRFGSDSSSRFINGVLGTVAAQVESRRPTTNRGRVTRPPE